MSRHLISVFFLAVLAVATTAALAQDTEIGRVKTVSGDTSIVRDGQRLPADIGAVLNESDEIETGADGSLGIIFNDNTVFSIGPNSRIALEEFAYDASTLEGTMLADLLEGTLAVTSGDIARSGTDAMRVRTPSAVLGVRGTRFLVRVRGAGS